MSDPRRALQKQGSLSHIEQSIKIIPVPPQPAPVTIYPGPKAGNINLSKADLEIADRLEKLRKKDVALPTEEEMASRLAQLKGLPTDHYKKSASVVYQPPDNRGHTEKSEDLLKQVMGEVALDEKVPKSDDELEARLARLRGVEPSRGGGGGGGVATTRSPLSSLPFRSPSGEAPPENLEIDEVEDLIRGAERELVEARSGVESLKKDPRVAAALATAARKKGKRRGGGEPDLKKSPSSSSDVHSSSSDEDNTGKAGTPKDAAALASLKESEEVNRIVNLYTTKAKEKKKRRALRKKEGNLAPDTPSTDGSEMSSSDLAVSSSESEKLSDSD